jgi:hypothetical protein
MKWRIFILLLAGFRVAAADVEPRYVFINRAPGLVWDAGNPVSFQAEHFEEIVDAIDAPENPALRVGVSFCFDFFRYDIVRVRESLARFLALSRETGIPVFIGLDGQNWWGGRPDLWNWRDPDRPGFDPENVHNVEWTGWDASTAVKIGWRNWGAQIRVLPVMNMLSPAVLEAHRQALDELLPLIQAWYAELPAEKHYLFGGVKLGHEAGLNYNAFYYKNGNRCFEEYPEDASHDPRDGLAMEKGVGGGVALLGYNAVKTGAIRDKGVITRDDLAAVTRRYLAALCARAHAAGLHRDRVYTHQGGTYRPWEKHMPFWPALNPHAAPGWSFYGVDPRDAEGLDAALDRREGGARWGAVEWWWGAADTAGWRDHFTRTLSYRNCRLIVIFNWDCGFRFRREQAGLEALRGLAADWPEPGAE